MDIEALLDFSVKNNASDLHLSAGHPPRIRLDGELHAMDISVVEHHALLKTLLSMMNHRQCQDFENHLETDFSFEINKLARFRVNVFNQSRGVAAVFRIIPLQIPTLDELHLPQQFKEIARLSRGLVLVTGATGSGKSTTMAAMLDFINTSRCGHILTIEDPVEFLYANKKSLVNQREVYRDTLSFDRALRSALREDPDVIMIGELRDLETIRLALTAAETGHLVLASVHTSSAIQTINRIIEVFPVEEQALIRMMLSESLQAVITQTLLKREQGGRVVALEMMRSTEAIRNLIRENKAAQMYSCMQTGQSQGMHTLDQHLNELVNKEVISRQTALDKARFKGSITGQCAL